MRGGVAAEQVLAHRAAGDEPRAHRRELGPDQREALVQRVQRRAPAGRWRPAPGASADEQLEPLRQRLRRLGQQPQRGGEAVARRWRARGRAAWRPASTRTRERLVVAGPRAALQVVGAGGQRARRARAQRGGGAARGRRSASRRRRTRRSRGARAGAGSGSGAGRRWRRSSAPASSSSSASSGVGLVELRGGRREVEVDRIARHRGALRERARRLAQRARSPARARAPPRAARRPPAGSAATARPAACSRASCWRKNGLPPPAS